MSGRQHRLDDPHLRRGPPSSLLLSDRISSQHREIQSLLLDNQRLASAHLSLKQELSLADEEVRQLASAARKVRDDRELEVKDLFQTSLKLEAEARAVDALRVELVRVRDDVKRLAEMKRELVAKLEGVLEELEEVKDQAREGRAIRADLEAMRQELQKGRAAIEFEKKTQAANLEHKRAMERNMMTMQREVERLTAELGNAEKRARAAAAAAANPSLGSGYMGNYGSPNLVYGGTPYPVQYPMHQAQNAADGGPPASYGPPPTVGGHHPYDMQKTNVPKG